MTAPSVAWGPAVLADAHHRLVDHLEAITGMPGATPETPCALPGWTRGHLLTHLARNADGLRRVLEGAERGESVEQYPGGSEARDAGIQAGVARAWEVLVADVRETAAALDAAIAGQQRWDGGGVNSGGAPLPAAEVPFLRCREVLIHHVDLGDDGYGPDDWPAEYLREELRRMEMAWNARKPMGATGLPHEALALPPTTRLMWLIGRTTVDGLPPAGVM